MKQLNEERIIDCVVGSVVLSALLVAMYVLFGGLVTLCYAVCMTGISVWVSIEIRNAYVEEEKPKRKPSKRKTVGKKTSTLTEEQTKYRDKI